MVLVSIALQTASQATATISLQPGRKASPAANVRVQSEPRREEQPSCITQYCRPCTAMPGFTLPSR